MTEPPAADAPAATRPEKPVPPKEGSFFRELPVLVLIAFGLAIVIKTFLVQAFYIPSESMEPTLLVDDRVLVNKLVYRLREPRRGDVIVLVGERAKRPRSFGERVRSVLLEGFGVTTPQERDFIKRVMALPGETIEMTRGVVTITGRDGRSVSLREPYAREDGEHFGPTTVPRGTYFVMGDNRPFSSDSRGSLGPVRREDIVGRAFVRIWPAGRFSFFRRPSYPPGSDPPSASAVPIALAGTGAGVLLLASLRLMRKRARRPAA